MVVVTMAGLAVTGAVGMVAGVVAYPELRLSRESSATVEGVTPISWDGVPSYQYHKGQLLVTTEFTAYLYQN